MRAFRDEEQTRYRETQYREFYDKKLIDKSSPVTNDEREFYRRLGSGELHLATNPWITAIILIGIFLFILFLILK